MLLKDKVKDCKKSSEKTELIKGKSATIISNITGSSHAVGTKVKLVQYQTGSTLVVIYKIEGDTNLHTKQEKEFELSPETKKELQNSLLSLEKSIKTIQDEQVLIKSRIKFMEDNGIEEYDETTFKTFHVLNLLEQKHLSKIEKAKLISTLLKE